MAAHGGGAASRAFAHLPPALRCDYTFVPREERKIGWHLEEAGGQPMDGGSTGKARRGAAREASWGVGGR